MSTTTTLPVVSEDLVLLQTDINNHIKSQEDLYKKLKESDYVLDIDKQMLGTSNTNTKMVTTDNINEKINELTETSDELTKELEYQTLINDYFNIYYNENTKLRQQYFQKINKLNKKLLEQQEEIDKLNPELKSLETKSSTNYRELKESKRNLNKQKYFKELYTVSAVAQAFVVIVLVLGITRTIPKITCIIVSSIIYLLLAIYVLYVVLFTNTDRDVVVFDKYKFPINKNAISTCDTAEKAKREKAKENELESKLVTLLDERNTKTQCLINGTNSSSTTTTQANDNTTTTTQSNTNTKTTTQSNTNTTTTIPQTTIQQDISA